ncbi:MAG: FG-GAP repeat protein [Planctomycetes bacterium]|nr:FG-GAP repeat protein [Planctomycetota bacterium]
MDLSRFVGTLSLGCLLAGSVAAQRLRYQFVGEPNERMGNRVAVAGDIDGDGHEDLLATANTRSVVFSGRDGRVLLSLQATVVIPAHDVDGDGHGDLLSLVGAELKMFSGKDAHVVWTIPNYPFSYWASVGDVDNDGVQDLVFGYPSQSGSLRCISAKTGKELWLVGGTTTRVGLQIAPVSDLDGDAKADFLHSGSATVEARSSKDGRVIRGFPNTRMLVNYPPTFADLGDIDRDGVSDVGVTASGALQFFSGKDATELAFFPAQANEGNLFSLVRAGDVDADGVSDVAALSTGSSYHMVVRSGKSGATILRVDGTSRLLGYTAMVGLAVADFDRDGAVDFAVGFPLAMHTPSASNSNGAVLVFTGPARTPGLTLFGTGCGSKTPPAIQALTPPRIADTLWLQASGLPENTFGELLLGFSDQVWNGRQLPLALDFIGAPGCTLLVAPFQSVPIFTGGGTWQAKVEIPPTWTLLGVRLYAQCFAPDPAANPLGVAVSAGAKIVIGS